MVAYDFPPSTVGIWRTIKFCRYMNEFGWHPSILTVRTVRCPRHDWRPLEELPEGVEVRRTHSLDTNRLAWLASETLRRLKGSRQKTGPAAAKGGSSGSATFAAGRAVMDVLRAWILMPDDRVGWMPFALAEGRRWLKEQRFDAIYSTCYPHTAHVVGARLARESGLPYMADFRDIWIGSYVFYHPPTAWHDRLQRGMERRVVEQASRVVTATEPITQDFRQRYPEIPTDRFITITNGFDGEDFRDVAKDADNEHFTITYAGTLFGAASPRALFQAARQLLNRAPQWRAALRFRFIGAMIEPYRRMIDEFNLGDITRVDGYLPHDEALAVMTAADALLLIIANAPGSHIMLTQKVFEYVAARRPVLALVPPGAAQQFLDDIGEGTVVPPDDAGRIEAALEKMLTEWQQSGRKDLSDNPALQRYTRRSLTERLCGELDAILH
jgi:glycosyltransferase involved in cell wall biosynthesis